MLGKKLIFYMKTYGFLLFNFLFKNLCFLVYKSLLCFHVDTFKARWKSFSQQHKFMSHQVVGHLDIKVNWGYIINVGFKFNLRFKFNFNLNPVELKF